MIDYQMGAVESLLQILFGRMTDFFYGLIQTKRGNTELEEIDYIYRIKTPL